MQKSIDNLVAAYNSTVPRAGKRKFFIPAYAHLFSSLRNQECTFIEFGVKDGGSLLFWREFLGSKARIIGVDLNPACRRFSDHGFEIFIFDQGDPCQQREFFKKIGSFDALLDDGGHQSFQQIVTLTESIPYANKDGSIIVVEDTHTSFLKDFKCSNDRTFLNYSKDLTDILAIRSRAEFGDRFFKTDAKSIEELFKDVWSISFYNGIVALHVNSSLALSDYELNEGPLLINEEPDFRYVGKSEASVVWPNVFGEQIIKIKGGKGIIAKLREKIFQLVR